MAKIDSLMPAFHDELTKEALLSSAARLAWKRGLGGLGSGAGAGGIIGAGGGALIGAGKEYRAAREQGASAVQAAGHGLMGGVMGGLKGGALGAAAGGAGLGALRAAGKYPGVSAKLTGAAGPVGASARFGQRQIHGLTGWKPEKGLQSIRGGAYAAKQEAEAAEKALRAAKAGTQDVGVTGKLRRKGEALVGRSPEKTRAGEVARAEKVREKAQKGERFAEDAERMGLTSLPGYAKSLAKKPLQTLRVGAGEQWHTQGPLMRSLSFGVPAGLAAKEMATPSAPGGPGKEERAGKELGYMAYGMAPLPIAGMMVAAPAASYVAGKAGKLIGKLRKKPSPELERA